MSSIAYRAEVDGLRAIAVLSVIFYHADFMLFGRAFLPGGFLGVDIFFVLSGYLISSILFREVSEGSFSIISFYERRARRILPALYFMMLATLPVAYFFLLPKGMMEYARSGLAALGFSSNIWFWLEDSYIAEASKLKPLLHTWSLAVEEQFYIVFPLFAYLLIRHASNRMWQWLIAVFVASLLLAQVGTVHFAKFNFYHLPTRAWELMGGSIVALASFQGKLTRLRQHYPALAEVGFMVLILCIILMDDHMPHPSLLTLLPVAGTMAILTFGKDDRPCYRFLALQPLVFIGLISYSLYLWHFPLFAFARNLDIFDLPLLKGLYILVASLLAYLAYRFIEQPLRNRQRIGFTKLIVAIFAMLLVLIAAYISILRFKGFPKSLGPLEAVFEELSWQRLDCTIDHPCNKKAQTHQHIISLGDSHSWNFDYPLRDMAERYERSYVAITRGSCPYILDTYVVRGGKPIDCTQAHVKEAHQSIDRLSPAIIIYKARLPVYLDKGHFYNNGEGGEEIENRQKLFNVLFTSSGSNEQGALADKIRATFQHLIDSGNIVVLIYPIPAVGWNVPDVLRRKLESIPDTAARKEALTVNPITTSYTRYKERTALTNQVLDSLGDAPNLIRIHPDQLLCSTQTDRCATQDENGVFYMDANHPSRYMATRISALIEQQLIAKGFLAK
ncbi:Peptidoglycan/LPS O-acetylase OafA/YrhL, contains acyltransferase and SGNH-hydrolase domains [Cohaesibacter marisflavi]|uniref:Peptidoglycan/LPS O-acetylase OafA/YrhL, contains acyltransferase and SGNH-hydrolase domains n=1 Tax=Cohaesibacter marisflavi TaxID=655353 RepID=A0A1I4ZCP2_9HYPH|nr:acyltransferase family protein [Cohaesibacter marisflavi]SFN47749.1 Peptidoglycan/LPS O-acetylase OafA/YrhL, contains acyltransferase and SGNH-hydrolase domains [Cohaesibacter marisflavi]